MRKAEIQPTVGSTSAGWILALKLMQGYLHLCYCISKQAEDRINRPTQQSTPTYAQNTHEENKKIYYSIQPDRKKDIKIQIAWFKGEQRIYILPGISAPKYPGRHVPIERKLIQGEIIACVALSESMFFTKERNSC